MVQENAPEAYRAQVLALFNLGFMGGAPLGALTIGFLVKFFGPHTAAFFPAVGMAIMCLVLYFATPIWSYRAMSKQETMDLA